MTVPITLYNLSDLPIFIADALSTDADKTIAPKWAQGGGWSGPSVVSQACDKISDPPQQQTNKR